MIRERLPTNKR